jgi:17beta-estradiol 17-dehydrogenase / very-long-chain 3-oxoacyl-CoA reductase
MGLLPNGVLMMLGGFTVLYLMSKLTMLLYVNMRPSSISKYCYPPPSDPSSRPWALVTGASRGLGFSLSCELASRGFNIVLHGRNNPQLSKIASDIRTRHPGTHTTLLILDATSLPAWTTFSQTISTVLSPLHLTLLVNNIGGPGDIRPEWLPIRHRTHSDLDKLLDLNLRFTLHLTHEVLPFLARTAKPALIMNISSGAAIAPLPYLTTYSASKAFLSSFGRGLRAEMQEEPQTKGIEVLTLEAGKFVSLGSGRTEKDLGLDTLAPEVVARACMDRVGCGRAVVAPDLGTQITLGLVKRLPEWVATWMIAAIARVEKEKNDRFWKEL